MLEVSGEILMPRSRERLDVLGMSALMMIVE